MYINMVLLPRLPMVSSLCFTCSAIILLMDIRLSVMLPLVSTRLSLVTFLEQTHMQSSERIINVLFNKQREPFFSHFIYF